VIIPRLALLFKQQPDEDTISSGQLSISLDNGSFLMRKEEIIDMNWKEYKKRMLKDPEFRRS